MSNAINDLRGQVWRSGGFDHEERNLVCEKRQRKVILGSGGGLESIAM